MKQQNYQCSISANVTAQYAFECITHISEWWTANFESSSQKLNDVWTVYFGETFVTAKVVEMSPYKQIVWEVIDCYLHWLNAKTEWNNTKLMWEISATDHSTLINFTHIGLVPGFECYRNCVKGWDHYVKESLFKLMTTGKGLPEAKKIPEKEQV